VIGRVAAGAPIESHEHIDDFHKVDPHLFTPRADYLLRVQGDSMRDVGILDGDLLAVHRTHEAHNGQIVVARVDHDDVTVKRFQKRGNTVQLIAENPDPAPPLARPPTPAGPTHRTQWQRPTGRFPARRRLAAGRTDRTPDPPVRRR